MVAVKRASACKRYCLNPTLCRCALTPGNAGPNTQSLWLKKVVSDFYHHISFLCRFTRLPSRFLTTPTCGSFRCLYLLCSSLSLTSAPSSLPPHAGAAMTFLWPPFLPACACWRPSNPGAKARWSSPIHDVVRGLNLWCRLDPHYQQPMEAFPDSIYAFLAMSHNMPCQLIRATGSQVKPSPTRSTPSPPWARRSLSRLDLCRVACSMCPSHRFESPEMTHRLLQLLCHLPDSWLGSCLFLAPLQYLVFPVLGLCICFFNFIMFGWNTYYWV
jgi:hypothetical protein